MSHALTAHVVCAENTLDYAGDETRAVVALASVFANRAHELVGCWALVDDSVLVVFFAVEFLVEGLLDSVGLLAKEHFEDLVIDELKHVYYFEFSAAVLADISAVFHGFFSIGGKF